MLTIILFGCVYVGRYVIFTKKDLTCTKSSCSQRPASSNKLCAPPRGVIRIGSNIPGWFPAEWFPDNILGKPNGHPVYPGYPRLNTIRMEVRDSHPFRNAYKPSARVAKNFNASVTVLCMGHASNQGDYNSSLHCVQSS